MNVHIRFAKIDFECKHCNKKYSDTDDKYVIRCNNNKSGCTKIFCKCGKSFFMTYDYMGNAVSFTKINAKHVM